MAVAGLLVVGAAPGHAAERSAPAQAVNLAHGTSTADGYECRQALVIRWADVKGVENYTLTFFDGHYQQEISLAVSAPFHDNDGFEPFRPPPGVHQHNWTGGVGFAYGPPPHPPCEAGTDTGRAQNPVVSWNEPGSFIEGTVTGRCESGEGECPVPGVKVQATAKGKRAKASTGTTDAQGNYDIKVGAGSYEVAAKKSKLRFDPKTKRVKVAAEQVARADFRAIDLGYDLETAFDNSETVGIVGHHIRYVGTNWDPQGGPITIKHGDEVLAKIPEAASFDRNVEIPPYRNRSCKDSMTVHQDGLRRRFEYSAPVTQVADYVRGKAQVRGGPRLKRGTNVCDGEDLKVDRDATLVAHTKYAQTLAADDGAYVGARVDAPWARIELRNLVTPRLELTFEKGKPEVPLPADPKYPAATFAETFDVDGKPGVVRFENGTRFERDLPIDGFARADGSVFVTGDVIGAGPAYFYLLGNLTAGGGIRASAQGYVASQGEISFAGARTSMPRFGFGVHALHAIEITD